MLWALFGLHLFNMFLEEVVIPSKALARNEEVTEVELSITAKELAELEGGPTGPLFITARNRAKVLNTINQTTQQEGKQS